MPGRLQRVAEPGADEGAVEELKRIELDEARREPSTGLTAWGALP